MLFISKKRHQDIVDKLRAELRCKNEQLGGLQQELDNVKRTRHEIVEDVRYILQAGGELIETVDPLRGKELAEIGQYLPYLLSSRRHWDYEAKCDPESAENARKLGVECGLSLPDDPAQAVRVFLHHAHQILRHSDRK